MSEVIADLALSVSTYPELVEYGRSIGKLYTDFGLPIDMALAEVDKKQKTSKLQKLAMIQGSCEWLIQHKRNSGATERSIDRQRKANRNMIESFWKTGETGAY